MNHPPLVINENTSMPDVSFAVVSKGVGADSFAIDSEFCATPAGMNSRSWAQLLSIANPQTAAKVKQALNGANLPIRTAGDNLRDLARIQIGIDLTHSKLLGSNRSQVVWQRPRNNKPAVSTK
jgi:hypothetical protein